MNFLFLVQGEGRGHMTQAVTLQNLLVKHGHTVSCVMVGKSTRRNIPSFFYQKIEAPVLTYESPNFIADKDQKGIKIGPTILYNLKKGRRYFKSLRFIRDQVKKYRPDAIINFYELLGGLYFGLYKPNIAHICIGHQYLIYHPDFEFPRGKRLDRNLLKLNTWVTSFRATKKLALSFRPLPDQPGKKTWVVPPLLREQVLEMQPEEGDYMLAYILNDGYRTEIMQWHQHHQDIPVHFFSDARQDIEQEKVGENITWHRIDDMKFLEYMNKCKAFASTAGFESVCEAMYLGKPIMMVPTKGHFEQECNAIDARKAGAGIINHHFDLSRLIDYISTHKYQGRDFKAWVRQAGDQFIGHLTNL